VQSCILSAKKLAPETVIERFVPVVLTWSDVGLRSYTSSGGLLRLHRIGTQLLQRIDSEFLG